MQFLVLEGDLRPLLRRLRPGALIKGRIVYCLPGQKYVLRLMGRNLVMRSPVQFHRCQEVSLKVRALQPQLQLQLARPAHKEREQTLNIQV